jgi:hypothetical protein
MDERERSDSGYGRQNSNSITNAWLYGMWRRDSTRFPRRYSDVDEQLHRVGLQENNQERINVLIRQCQNLSPVQRAKIYLRS